MSTQCNDALAEIVFGLCKTIDSPRSLSVWLCFKHNQAALLELPMPDIANNNTSAFQLDYFITEYLQKYKALETSVDLRDVALRKWRLSEQQCKMTNERFRTNLRGFTPRVESIYFRSQRKIASVLGAPTLGILTADCKWGPGATFDLDRMRSGPDNKILETISTTESCLPYLKQAMEADPHWFAALTGIFPSGPYSMLRCNYNVVRGSRFLTVPKNAKTDRCIAAEPTGNGFVQQGVHAYMRRRLRRFGVNLDDQSINQSGARLAYSDGLATLDLSAASDTISLELIFHLLPIDWALFLDDIRSKWTIVDGQWIRLEKFASMGNAFCFELETLIFWALACSVCEELGLDSSSVSVYGDDIIVSQAATPLLAEMLAEAGFTVNQRKSYVCGNFFESCGEHFHRGLLVTPCYQKEVLTTPSELIRAHNRLYRLSYRLLDNGRAERLRQVLKGLQRCYPLKPLPTVPHGSVEDGGFLAPRELFALDRNHGFRCHVLDFIPTRIRQDDAAMLAYRFRRRRNTTTPSGFNSDPRGYPITSGAKGKWRSKIRYIPEMLVYITS